MEDRAGIGSRPQRKNLGDQRRRYRPLAAHAHRDQEAQDADLPQLAGEEGQARKHGINQDGDDQRGPASPAVSQGAEHDTADRAADLKHAQEYVAVVFDERVLGAP